MVRPIVMTDGPLPDELESRLRVEVELLPWTNQPDERYRSTTAIFSLGHPIVDAQLLDALPNVRLVSNHGVGVDHIDLQACADRNVIVGNTPAVLDGAVGDAAFALLLAAARRVVESVAVAKHPDTLHFDQSKLHGQEVHHATLGIIGLGRVGRQVARRAIGFDMEVLYFQRNRNPDAEASLSVRFVELAALLRQSDFVMLTVPLTDSTRGLIGAAELALMKPTAVLVNMARGPVVKTDDLVHALQNQQIWAAALDVTDPEPLPRDHALLNMSNVVVTSHIGSASRQTRQQMVDLAVKNLFQGLQGKEVVFVV